MFAVKTVFNTDEFGNEVPDGTDEEDCPTTYHGPFDSLESAIEWLENVYPDGGTDVIDQYAHDYDIPTEWLNDPNSLFQHTEGAPIGLFFQGNQAPKP